MRFWDASALISLFIDEPNSTAVRSIATADGSIAAWWGSPVECCSAIARARREGGVELREEDRLRRAVAALAESWTEILPTVDLRHSALRLLLRHALRASDGLQLAAALVWAGGHATDQSFVCLDVKLRLAARNEGFIVLPEDIRAL